MLDFLRRLFSAVPKSAAPTLPPAPSSDIEKMLRATGAAGPEKWAALLAPECVTYRINSPIRRAMFVATGVNETGGFRVFEEGLNYSAAGLASNWPNRYAGPDGKPNALALRLARNPQAIANNCYADRMGNGPEASGDGWRYRGAGAIQATGKSNHALVAAAFGKTLSEVGPWMLTPEGAVKSAAFWWDRAGANEIADTGDTRALRKRVNGGTIGLAEFQRLYALAIGAAR